MGMWGLRVHIFAFLCFGLGLSACAPQKSSPIIGTCKNRVSTVYSRLSERSYCTTTTTHASPVTITGTATFESRAYTPSSGLGAIGAPKPIRYAEVVAYSPEGNIVQCTETDTSGNFSLQMPTSSDTYSLHVYSRGDNASVKASVLNCPEENAPYSISATVTPDVTKSVGTINADADNAGELLGAAFNIYDQIVQANDFFRAEVGTCAFTGCNAFTVAPKVQIYWEKGFNPNSYFDSSSGLSFYLPSYRKLYILGGIDGDIYNSDTDHFDNSVILHEYGHFIEDVYTDTDSPGGSHSGNSIIDPRLAWGEGWGNFIQAAIRNEAKYRDTDGTPNASNPASTSMYIFNIPLETTAATCVTNPNKSGCDIPIFAAEGNFREFSVARMLWDVFDSASNADSASDDPIENAFAELWTALTWSSGFLNTNAAFRNIGLLHDTQASKISGSSDWSSLRTAHKQDGNTEYARYVTATGSCTKEFAMTPFDDPSNDNGSFATSHRVENNDFLHYHHSGGVFTLTMKALTDNPAGVKADLDLYLYNSNARYGNSSDIVKSSDNYADNNAATEQTETFTIPNLAAGNYLINVKVYTGINQSNSGYHPAGDPLTYELIANGVNLCTTTLP
ncbi:MAG: hypothetical protein KDD38_02175 [Bdellovibrionales bacterium]|nr:hypothetical protein [Bdellovibrionales bacterium]